MEVVIGQRNIDPALFSQDFVLAAGAGAEAGGLPPGSINLYVFSTCDPDLDGDNDIDGADMALVVQQADFTCLAALAGMFGRATP